MKEKRRSHNDFKNTGSGSFAHFIALLFLATVTLFMLFGNMAFAGSGFCEWKLLGPGDADMVMSLSFVSDTVVMAGTDIGGLYVTRDSGKSWEACNTGLKNYDVTTPAIVDPWNPKVVYVGTRGGFYKSVDGGESWQGRWGGLAGPKDFYLSAPVGSIAVSLKKEGVIYMGFGLPPHRDIGRILSMNSLRKGFDGKFYKSINGGESWKAVSVVKKRTPIRCIALSSFQIGCIYVATDSGVFISSDDGRLWKKLLDGQSNYIVLNPKDEDELIVSTGEKGVMRSADGGKNWEYMNQGLPTGKRNNYSVLSRPKDEELPLYILNSTWAPGGGLYMIEGVKQPWTRLTLWRGTKNMPESWLKGSKRIHAIAVNPLNGEQIFIGSSRYIYRSDNRGRSWEQLISDRMPSGDWTHRGMNVFGQTRSIAIDPLNPQRLYVGTGDHGLVKSEDRGMSWRPSVHGMKYKNGVLDIAISKADPARIYAITTRKRKQCGVGRSDDYGETWRPISKGISEESWLYCLLVDPLNADLVYVAGKDGVYKTENGGRSWRGVNGDLPLAAVLCLARADDSPNTIYAGTDKGLYRSTDGGESWVRVSRLYRGKVTAVLIDRQDPKIIYMGTRQSGKQKGGLYKSLDEGKTWLKVITDIRWLSSIAQIPSHPNILYASTNDHNYHDESSGSGIFRSIDGGNTWQGLNNGLAVRRAFRLGVSPVPPHLVYLCSNGSGIYVMDHSTCLNSDNPERGDSNIDRGTCANIQGQNLQ